MPLTAQEIVQREVLACVSSLIATLARVSGMAQSAIDADREAWELFNAATELSFPVDDYEEAAVQSGWSFHPDGTIVHPDHGGDVFTDAERACNFANIDPYQREVFEHWIVSDWFADKLIEAGEKVDKDFAGLCIWARTTTGQAVYADAVIERIAAKLAEG
jgi:hypothetical protein